MLPKRTPMRALLMQIHAEIVILWLYNMGLMKHASTAHSQYDDTVLSWNVFRILVIIPTNHLTHDWHARMRLFRDPVPTSVTPSCVS